MTTEFSADRFSEAASTAQEVGKAGVDALARNGGRFITPAAHAMLDYSVASVYFAVGASLVSRHRRAATLAFLNAAMVLGMSMMTDYPGGVWRRLSFKGHRNGDVGQALLAGLGPILMGFAGDREASFFYGQAASEVGVIAATDWDAA